MTLSPLQQYGVVTANYWAFTLTDGALRMLVVFHFHALGYSTLEIAGLFLFYEFFGVLTNLTGGWIGARYGLRLTLWIGTLLQIAALLMLIPVSAAWPKLFSVIYVMAAQAISGIAKDLNKMSAKSAIKTVVPDSDAASGGDQRLFRWVAILTGSKNALKGVGFFLGGVLLTALGFNAAVAWMAGGLALAFLLTLVPPAEIGRMRAKPGFSSVFSKSKGINVLSLARFFLFGARDVWFVVALPVFLSMPPLGWSIWEVGGFLGLWTIGYGIVQGAAPGLRRLWGQSSNPGPAAVQFWSAVLTAIPALIAVALWRQVDVGVAITVGLALFGIVFAMNSSIHSYMVLAYTDQENVSLNVGFYYMANAAGRLVGTLLSGAVFMLGRTESAGMQACLWVSSLLVLLSWFSSRRLPSPSAPLNPA